MPLPTKHFQILTFIIFALLYSHISHAHSHASDGNEPGVEHYMNFLEKMGHLNIDSESSNRTMQAMVRLNYTPFFNIGGEKILVDNAFWEMTDELTRIYLREIKNACNDCQLPSIEEVRQQAQSLVARGWFTNLYFGIKNAVLYRYGLEFAGLAARYGTAAGIAKVAGELIEDAMLVVFKMPGAHFLCEAITAAIGYYSGATLTLSRSFFYPKYFNANSIGSLAKLIATSHYTSRSLERLTIEVPEFTLNEEDFREFKEEHRDRKLLYRVTGRHRAESFIKKLQSQVQKKRQRITNLQAQSDLSRRQKQELIDYENKGISTLVTLQKRVFDGYRYKRFAFLKKRNTSTSIGQFASDSKHILRGTEFWFFELKNEIFEPHVMTEAQEEFRKGINPGIPKNNSAALDPVTLEQLSAFTEPASRQMAEHLFETLDKIGDSNVKMSHRYLHNTFLGAFYGQLLPNLIDEASNHFIEDIVHDIDEKHSDVRFRDVFKFKWNARKLAYYSDIFVDYMRFHSLSAKNNDPTRKYHIRDYALQILKSYSGFSQFREIHTLSEVQEASEYLKEQMRVLDTERFWLDKSQPSGVIASLYQWIPGLNKRPVCEELY